MIEFLSCYYLILFCFFCFVHLRYGIFLIILSLPSYLIRYTIFDIPFTLLELQILLLFVFWLFTFPKQAFKSPYNLPILSWILAGTMAVFIAPDMWSALGLWKAYIIEPVLFFYICQHVLTTKEIPSLIKAFCLLTSSIFIIAFLQYIEIIPSLSPWIDEIPKRVVSVFEYPNAIALLLTPWIVFCFVLYQQNAINISKPWLFCTIILGCISILFSWSKAGMLTIICSFLLSFLFLKKFRPFAYLLFFVLLLIFSIPYLRETSSRLISFSDTSTDVRLVLWQGTFRLLQAHPLTGAGLAGFPDLYETYKLTKHTELLQYPHNIFLDVWVEMGIVGLCAFLYIVIKFFYIIVQCNSKICTALFFTMIAFLGYGLVDSPLFKNDLIVLFWLYIALSDVFFKHAHPPISQGEH